MSHILLHESTEGTILPPEIEQLLAKYPDVILEEIPPQRDKHRRLQTFKVGDLKINDNAYKVELPCSCGVSTTFNIANLSPYLNDEAESDSRASPVKPEEDETEP
ncbi:putative gag-pol polyprotein [Sesbania bispinosa]|nr:putative gag-pol polyprotein [Sesbania bispinosa]